MAASRPIDMTYIRSSFEELHQLMMLAFEKDLIDFDNYFQTAYGNLAAALHRNDRNHYLRLIEEINTHSSAALNKVVILTLLVQANRADAMIKIIQLNKDATNPFSKLSFLALSYFISLFKKLNHKKPSEIAKLVEVMKKDAAYKANEIENNLFVYFAMDETDNKYQTVKQLLKNNPTDLVGFAVLFEAKKTLKEFGSKKINALSPMTMGPYQHCTPWHIAVLYLNEPYILQCLSDMTDDEKQRAFYEGFEIGLSALATTAIAGRENVAKILLNNGHSITVESSSGKHARKTPLMLALEFGRVEIADLLTMSYGQSVDRRWLLNLLRNRLNFSGKEVEEIPGMIRHFCKLVYFAPSMPSPIPIIDILKLFCEDNLLKFRQLKIGSKEQFADHWHNMLDLVNTVFIKSNRSSDYDQTWIMVAKNTLYKANSPEKKENNASLYRMVIKKIASSEDGRLQFPAYIHALVIFNEIEVLQTLPIAWETINSTIGIPLAFEAVALGLTKMLVYLKSCYIIDPFAILGMEGEYKGKSLLRVATESGSYAMVEFILREWNISDNELVAAMKQDKFLESYFKTVLPASGSQQVFAQGNQVYTTSHIYHESILPLQEKIKKLATVVSDQSYIELMLSFNLNDDIESIRKIIFICLQLTDKSTRLFLCLHIAISYNKISIIEYCLRFNNKEKNPNNRLSLLELGYLFSLLIIKTSKEQLRDLILIVTDNEYYKNELQSQPNFLLLAQDDVHDDLPAAYYNLRFQGNVINGESFFLFYASLLNATRTIRKIISANQSNPFSLIHCDNHFMMTPLHIAAFFNQTAAIAALTELEDGHPVHVQIKGGLYAGYTPLMIAIEQGNTESAKVLVNAGAKVSREWLVSFFKAVFYPPYGSPATIKYHIACNLLLENPLSLPEIFSLLARCEMVYAKEYIQYFIPHAGTQNFVHLVSSMYAEKSPLSSLDLAWCDVADVAFYPNAERENILIQTIRQTNDARKEIYLKALIILGQTQIIKQLTPLLKTIDASLKKEFVFIMITYGQLSLFRYFVELNIIDRALLFERKSSSEQEDIFDTAYQCGHLNILKYIIEHFALNIEALLAKKPYLATTMPLLDLDHHRVPPQALEKASALANLLTSENTVAAVAAASVNASSSSAESVFNYRPLRNKIKNYLKNLAKKSRLKYDDVPGVNYVTLKCLDAEYKALVSAIYSVLNKHLASSVGMSDDSITLNLTDAFVMTLIERIDNNDMENELQAVIKHEKDHIKRKNKLMSAVTSDHGAANQSESSQLSAGTKLRPDEEADYVKVLSRLGMNITFDKSNSEEWVLILSDLRLTDSFVTNWLVSRLNKNLSQKKLSSTKIGTDYHINFPLITLNAMSLEDLGIRIDDISRYYADPSKFGSPDTSADAPANTEAGTETDANTTIVSPIELQSAEIPAPTTDISLLNAKKFFAKLIGVDENKGFGELSLLPFDRQRKIAKFQLAFLPQQMHGLNLFGMIVSLREVWRQIPDLLVTHCSDIGVDAIRFYDADDNKPTVRLVVTHDSYYKTINGTAKLANFQHALKELFSPKVNSTPPVNTRTIVVKKKQQVENQVKETLYNVDTHLFSAVAKLATGDKPYFEALRNALNYHLQMMRGLLNAPITANNMPALVRAYSFQCLHIMNTLSQIRPEDLADAPTWCYSFRCMIKHEPTFSDRAFYNATVEGMRKWINHTELLLNCAQTKLNDDELSVFTNLTHQLNLQYSAVINPLGINALERQLHDELATALQLITNAEEANHQSSMIESALFLTAMRIYTLSLLIKDEMQLPNQPINLFQHRSTIQLAAWLPLQNFYKQMSHFRFSGTTPYKDTFAVMASNFFEEIKRVLDPSRRAENKHD